MAPLITHLVVGERVFGRVQYLSSMPLAYGSFLLGCVLVDVHSFSEDIDRRQTHFVGRPEENGENTFQRSCDIFLSLLDSLLARPWNDLSEAEQGFVAGYLCHLAADEPWKETGWKLLRNQHVSSWTDFRVPGVVILTAFGLLSSKSFVDFPAVASALGSASVPDVLTHVPGESFHRMWDITRGYLLKGGTAESYFALLESEGQPRGEIEGMRRLHAEYWEEAIALVCGEIGGVEHYIQSAVGRSMQVVPHLWTRC